MKVKSIQVSGNARTKLHFFEKELAEALASHTVDHLHAKLDDTVGRLRSYGIFDAVSMNIDVLSTDLVENKYEVAVQVGVREKQITTAKVQTYVRASHQAVGDLSLEVNAGLRNASGYGEVGRLAVVTTSSGSREILAEVRTPFPAPLVKDLSLTARSTEDNLSRFSGFRQQESGITLQTALNLFDVRTLLGLKSEFTSEQKIQFNFSLRDEVPVVAIRDLSSALKPSSSSLPPKASDIIHSSALPSTKASVKYSYSNDTRNQGCNSTKGQLLQVDLEAALPPGTAQFLRGEIRAESHATIGPKLWSHDGLSLSLCSAFGLLSPFSRSYLSDRYYLGGPLSLRGFGTHGCGARGSAVGVNEWGNPVGGTAKVSLLASLHCPIPVKSIADSGGRTFLFFNCGNIGSGLSSALSFGFARASLGIGASFSLGPARFECTYALPILKADQDVVKQFQFGAGLDLI